MYDFVVQERAAKNGTKVKVVAFCFGIAPPMVID